LRMRESVRSTPREGVIRRLEGIVQREGFRTLLVGGEYSLLGDMGRLITSSIITGSLLLIGIFTLMGLVFSRSWRVGAAMLLTLAIIPVVVRGYIANLLVICCGFGIFLLSNFPPTLRFGVFVIFGSATAASAAVLLFPWLASISWRSRKTGAVPDHARAA